MSIGKYPSILLATFLLIANASSAATNKSQDSDSNVSVKTDLNGRAIIYGGMTQGQSEALHTAVVKSQADDLYHNSTAEQRSSAIQGWETKSEGLGLVKQALLFEQGKKYGEAVESLKQALSKKDLPGVFIGAVHLSLQRCYEQLHDTVSEKYEVEWIFQNVLSPQGQYRASGQVLTTQTITHLNERKKSLDAS